MESKSNKPPLVVIVGETASGKSALALKLARQFNGEIIAADSRTIYRGMDIGTAKPTQPQRLTVPHHLLDIVTPDEPITVADYKELANKAIDDITSRGNIPFLVGGTGLYIDAVLFDFSFALKGDETAREKWRNLSTNELQAELTARGLPLPRNSQNPRHLIRQLEIGEAVPTQRALREHTLVLGLTIDREELRQRVAGRVEEMMQQGLESEVAELVARYGWGVTPLQTIGYQEFRDSEGSTGSQRIKEVKEKIKTHTLQYAKRQRSWFRRNKSIHWIAGGKEAVDLITTFLNK